MLIEIDISQELPDIMLIKEADGTYREQVLDYECKPSFCERCFQIGKHDAKCEKAPPEKEKR